MATQFTTGDFIASTTSGEAASFVPEQWSSEYIAPYKKARLMSAAVTVWNFVGEYGDVIHVPVFVRGIANVKAVESVVTPNVTNSTLTDITIDKHIEYTVLLEKFAEVQAMPAMRRAFIEDAALAIAMKIDWDLHLLGRSAPSTTPAVGGNVTGTDYGDAVIGSNGSTTWDPTASGNAGNATALTDAGIRRLNRTMDDSAVPMSDRRLIIPPVELESLRGIARFTEQAFVGNGSTISNGLLGNLYGVPVAVSQNCPFVLDGASSADQRAGLLLHKGAFVLVEQLRVQAVTAFLSDFLATQLTWHTIYGVKEVRATNVIPFVVPS